MIRIIRWLTGTRELVFEGGFAEGFLNSCYENRLNIYKVKRDGEKIYLSAPAGLKETLEALAQKNGGSITVVGERGLFVLLNRLEGRLGILCGLLFCVFLVNFLNGFVWDIEVKGNESLSSAEVISFLEDAGFHKGVYFKSVDKRVLESLLMSSFEEVGWAHINRSGTKATVEISEAVKKPKVYDGRGANLVAKKDGVILKATVSRGFQRVRKGEAVTRGMLLASGVEEQGGKNKFEFAQGEFIAEVKEKIDIRVNRTQKYKAYSESANYKSLYFFGLDIPLTLKRNKAADYDEKEITDYIYLNSQVLPIGIKTKTVTPYTVYERELGDEVLKKLCEKECNRYINDNFSKDGVLSKSIKISVNGDVAEASGYLICTEDIAQEVIIKY